METKEQGYRKPRAISSNSRGTARQDQRRCRPYSPTPPRTWRYRKPSYNPSIDKEMQSIYEEEGVQEAPRVHSRRPEHLGLLECSYKLNFTDTKRVIVGVDMKTECTPFIAIGKVGGSCVTFSYEDWCELMKNEKLISSYFHKDIAPHSIPLGNLLLRFKTIFGTKSLVIESANQENTQHSVYLAKTSWYGLVNYETSIRMRYEERKAWSSHVLRLVNLQRDSMIQCAANSMKDGEISNGIPWDSMSSDKVNPVDLGNSPPSLNVKALSEEISAFFNTQDGRNFLEEIYFQKFSNT